MESNRYTDFLNQIYNETTNNTQFLHDEDYNTFKRTNHLYTVDDTIRWIVEHNEVVNFDLLNKGLQEYILQKISKKQKLKCIEDEKKDILEIFCSEESDYNVLVKGGRIYDEQHLGGIPYSNDFDKDVKLKILSNESLSYEIILKIIIGILVAIVIILVIIMNIKKLKGLCCHNTSSFDSD